MLSGDNGLLKRAGDARDETVVGQEKEQVELAYISAAVKKLGDNVDEEALRIELNSSVGNGKTNVSTNDDNTLNVYYTDTEHNYNVNNGTVTPTKVMPTVTIPPTTAVSENTKYKDTNNDIAIIPTGFRVSDNTDEQTIETGLVVKDSKENEWVWIPVEDVTEMYTTEGAPYTLCGGTGVTSSMASKSEIISGTIRKLPGITTDRREPDLSTDYDNDTTAQTAGFENLVDMAQSLVDDYEKMIESIDKYRGFYVGRYEMSGTTTLPTEQGNKTPLSNVNWYKLYKACKEFTNNSVESRMIWGCQWDIIMNWMLNSSDIDVQTYVTDSSGKGNYSNYTINTGSNSDYKVNNIYDLAGNCWEITQEVGNFYGKINGSYTRYQRSPDQKEGVAKVLVLM